MTTSLPNFVPGDHVTDALGELILDAPTRRSWTRHVGELRLMAAVLEDAINVVRKCPRSRAGREAREWMNSTDTTWPFAFERICEAFEIDPAHVRRQVTAKRPVQITQLPFDIPGLAATGT